MDPKMVPEFDPQNGSKNGTQKGGPILFWFKKDLQEIKALFKKMGPPFGCHFGGQILAPFLGPFFNLHFGSKNGAKFAKVFAVKAA